MTLKDGTYSGFESIDKKRGYYTTTKSLYEGYDLHQARYHALEHQSKGGLTGVWTDFKTGKIYVDESYYTTSKRKAIKFARKRGELAIYDCKNQKSLYLTDLLTKQAG